MTPLRLPIYWILFRAKPANGDYLPIIAIPDSGIASADERGTVPHGLDHDLVEVLSTLWLGIHLPRTVFDTIRLGSKELEQLYDRGAPQLVILLPIPGADDLLAYLPDPDIIFFPADQRETAAHIQRKSDRGARLLQYPTDARQSLQEAWSHVCSLFDTSRDRLPLPPPILEPIQNSALALPLSFVRRQFASDANAGAHSLSNRPLALVEEAIQLQATIRAIAQMERNGLTREQIVHNLKNPGDPVNAPSVNLCVSVVAPGVPTPYTKKIHGGRAATKVLRDQAENDAFCFLAAHHALARTGVGFVLQEIEWKLFEMLDSLETHCVGRNRNAKKTWKMLNAIGSKAALMFGPDVRLALEMASHVTVFSNFPMGLAILPDETAPLAFSRPVAYRPLSPLTRAIQFEIAPIRATDVQNRLRVLVAECLEQDDPARAASKVGWDAIVARAEAVPGVRVDVVDVRSVGQLSEKLSDGYDMLILSAHGKYDRKYNWTGIWVGGKVTNLLDIHHVPPVVIFSACVVSPRGVGAVSVADLMLRNGAVAVLGTLIPVDASRNAQLMSSFFFHITSAMLGRIQFNDLSSIWCYTIHTGAVFDILSTNKRLREWVSNDRGALEEIANMLTERRSRGTHAYEDAFAVLEAVARSRGFYNQFRASMNNDGYFPECAFYVFLGSPEQVLVRGDGR